MTTEEPKRRSHSDRWDGPWRRLPDASMMLGCPLRSGARRDDPGMLTGSERTGWILHMAVIVTRVPPPQISPH